MQPNKRICNFDELIVSVQETILNGIGVAPSKNELKEALAVVVANLLIEQLTDN